MDVPRGTSGNEVAPRQDRSAVARRDWRQSAGLLLAGWIVTASVTAASEPQLQFNRDIRPILAEHCLTCHGPDARQRQAALRLDLETEAKGELPSGNKAIVSGKSRHSELMARIASADEASRMPPVSTGAALTPEQIELVRRWIDAGAPWSGHWSLEPITRPGVPAVVNDASVRNSIDRFVRARHSEHQLRSSGPADRVTLLRRVRFDLVGLPPAPAEVAAFLHDPRPDAYDRVVDRLLSSPHFGERMAIGWLDLVRYADTCGFFADRAVPVAAYRDWVIGAFNANLSFDRFTIEQLAGDLLPDATDQQRIAAAYNRLGRMSNEAGVQEREYLSKALAERVRNVGTVWLGLTLGCCECHDHKYDPLPTRDFYRMGAFFADIKERGIYDKTNNLGIDWGPVVRLGTPEQLAEFSRLDSETNRLKTEMEALQSAFRDPVGSRAEELEAWEAGLRSVYEWKTLDAALVESHSGTVLEKQPDGSVRASGPRAVRDRYLVRAAVPLARFNAVRLEVLPDPSCPEGGSGRADDGGFVLTGVRLRLGNPSAGTSQEMRFESASASFEQTDAPGDVVSRVWSAASAISGERGEPRPGWAVSDHCRHPHEAIFSTGAEIECGSGDELSIELDQDFGEYRTLGRFRLSLASAPQGAVVYREPLPPAVCRIVSLPRERRSDQDRRDLAAFYTIHHTPAGRRCQEQIDAHVATLRQLAEQFSTALTVESVVPRPVRVLARGNWQDELGELVEPGVPGVLPDLAATGARPTRLDLAKWLVSPDNPLTARVLVNRLWKTYFGTALSRHVDDLGIRGEWPTHPELLDWLAAELIESGWDVKHIVRLIVTSETYRQSSTPSARSRAGDPENRWLSHQSPIRLEAELIRDNALAASGLLSARIGGRSVKPYQPENYWRNLKEIDRLPRDWVEAPGDDQYRRGLYTHWQRQFLHPMLLAFDAPSREECAADRARSNTPMQALTLLNDPTFVEAARALAQRALQARGLTADERLGWMYDVVLSRSPSPAELSVLQRLLDQHLVAYEADPLAAAELLSIGRHPVPADADLAELAAWTGIARAVLNLHDAIVRK